LEVQLRQAVTDNAMHKKEVARVKKFCALLYSHARARGIEEVELGDDLFCDWRDVEGLYLQWAQNRSVASRSDAGGLDDSSDANILNYYA
jgi:hypothetical protein